MNTNEMKSKDSTKSSHAVSHEYKVSHSSSMRNIAIHLIKKMHLMYEVRNSSLYVICSVSDRIIFDSALERTKAVWQRKLLQAEEAMFMYINLLDE
jgi:hypothetical protein